MTIAHRVMVTDGPLGVLRYIRDKVVTLNDDTLFDTCSKLYFKFDKKVWDDIKGKIIMTAGIQSYKVYETNYVYLIHADKNIEDFKLENV